MLLVARFLAMLKLGMICDSRIIVYLARCVLVLVSVSTFGIMAIITQIRRRLTQIFLKEDPSFFMRTLSVTDTSVAPAFIFDFYHSIDAVRRMPTFSTPGLIDHY